MVTMIIRLQFLYLNLIVLTAYCSELPLKATVYLPFEYLAADNTTPGGTYVGTAYGNVSVVPGVVGNALFIAGDPLSNLWLGDLRDSCFWSPGLCTEGYTIAFWLNIEPQFTNTRYYLSNGGQSAHSFGICFQLKQGNQFTSHIKTFTKKWSLGCEVTINKCLHFALVWSEENGAKLFLNGNKCDERGESSANDSQLNTGFNDFYIGKSNVRTESHGGEGTFDELLFWPEEKGEDFVSDLYSLYHNQSSFGDRNMRTTSVGIKAHKDKKPVDGVGKVFTVKSHLDCIRKCFITTLMCLVAEWTESGSVCKLANVLATDPMLTDQIGSTVYEKFFSYP